MSYCDKATIGMTFQLPEAGFVNPLDDNGAPICWDSKKLQEISGGASLRTVERALADGNILPTPRKPSEVVDENGEGLKRLVRDDLEADAKRRRLPSLVVQQHESARGRLLMANDARGGRKWMWLEHEPARHGLETF